MNNSVKEKYQKYIDTFKMTNKELFIFLVNYHDAVAFNDYLTEEYLKFDFNSDESLLKLISFFKNNNINEKDAKEILIASPVILSSKNPETDITVIYKEEKIEGITIRDSEGNYHKYPKNKSLRNITEESKLLENISTNSKRKKLIKKDNE